MLRALISLMFSFFGMLFNLSDQVGAGLKVRKVVKVQSTKGWILGKRKSHLTDLPMGLQVFIKGKGPAFLPGVSRLRPDQTVSKLSSLFVSCCHSK